MRLEFAVISGGSGEVVLPAAVGTDTFAAASTAPGSAAARVRKQPEIRPQIVVLKIFNARCPLQSFPLYRTDPSYCRARVGDTRCCERRIRDFRGRILQRPIPAEEYYAQVSLCTLPLPGRSFAGIKSRYIMAAKYLFRRERQSA
jgi:hypothetical protein